MSKTQVAQGYGQDDVLHMTTNQHEDTEKYKYSGKGNQGDIKRNREKMATIKVTRKYKDRDSGHTVKLLLPLRCASWCTKEINKEN